MRATLTVSRKYGNDIVSRDLAFTAIEIDRAVNPEGLFYEVYLKLVKEVDEEIGRRINLEQP